MQTFSSNEKSVIKTSNHLHITCICLKDGNKIHIWEEDLLCWVASIFQKISTRWIRLFKFRNRELKKCIERLQNQNLLSTDQLIMPSHHLLTPYKIDTTRFWKKWFETMEPSMALHFFLILTPGSCHMCDCRHFSAIGHLSFWCQVVGLQRTVAVVVCHDMCEHHLKLCSMRALVPSYTRT